MLLRKGSRLSVVVTLGLLGSGCTLLFSSEESKPPVVPDAQVPPLVVPDAGQLASVDAGGPRPGVVFVTRMAHSVNFASGKDATSVARDLCDQEAKNVAAIAKVGALVGLKFSAYLHTRGVSPISRTARAGWQTPDGVLVRDGGLPFALGTKEGRPFAVYADGSAVPPAEAEGFRLLIGSPDQGTDCNCTNWTQASTQTLAQHLYLADGSPAAKSRCCNVNPMFSDCNAPPGGHLLCVEDLRDSDSVP